MGYENFSFQSKYNVTQFVGSGAYGRVYKGTYIDGTTVALKEIIIPADDEGIPLSTLRELSVLKKVQSYNCAYLVQMFDVSLKKQDNGITIYIVFEFFECDLSRFLSHHVPKSGLPPEKIRNLSEQLLKGTEFLHSHRIIHRDLKPANIMIDKEGRQLKITDFGLSRVLGWESSLTPIVVTLWYRAPEILIQSEYLSPCDVWAAGCIVAELFNRQALFQANTDMGMLKLIFETIGFPSDCEWPALSHIRRSDFPSNTSCSKLRSKIQTNDVTALDLLEKMISFHPGKRITASAALKLPYFQQTVNITSGNPRENVLHPSNSQKGITKQPTLIRPPSRPARHSINTVYPMQSCAAAMHAPCVSHIRPVDRRQLCSVGGWDEVDSVPKMSGTKNLPTILSHSTSRNLNRTQAANAPKQPVHSDCSADVDEHQYDLIISVVNNAIDDASLNPQTASSITSHPNKNQPRRPVTRQQTRAARRYTQPAKTTSTSRDLDLIPEILNIPHSFDYTALNKPLPSQNQVVVQSAESSICKPSTSFIQTGRQRRTARRRTVIGPAENTTGSYNRKSLSNSNQVNTRLPAPKSFNSGINTSSKADRSTVSTSQALSAVPCLVINREDVRETLIHSEKENQSHANRSTRFLDHHQMSRQRNLPQHNQSGPSRAFSRYSLGPSYTYLHSIQEQHPTADGLRDEKVVSKSNLITAFDEVDGFTSKLDGNSLCSPSKLPKVAQDHFQQMTQPVVTLTESRSSNMNSSELHDCEDDEIDDNESTDVDESNNQLANTSLGINSAMTGLAIVNCNMPANSTMQTSGPPTSSQSCFSGVQHLNVNQTQVYYDNAKLDDPKLGYSTSVDLTNASPKHT